MNTFEKLAYGTGRTIARFNTGLNSLVKANRAGFIGAMAEAGKWSGGDYTRRGSQRRALTNSWYYTGLNMITNEISAGRMKVMQTSGAEPVELTQHLVPRLLRRPNPWMGRSYLWQYTIAWLYLDGNAYWFVQYDENGQPVEIWPLPSQDVEVWPGDDQRFVDFYRYTANGRFFDIASEYIIHFQFPNPFDVFRGLSPLTAAMLPIDSDIAMAFWNGAFFGRDNVMPSSIINLKPGEGMNQEDMEADIQSIKDDLRENYGASKRKSLITSYDAVQAVLMGWNAKDMDFIAGRQLTKEEIYQILGVPAGLLDKNATEANAAIADKIFKEKTIWPIMVMLAEQLSAQLVVPLWGDTCEAVFDDIRPANRAMELAEIAAAGPYLFVDEVRQKYWSLPPLPNGEGAVRASAASPTSGSAPGSLDGMPKLALDSSGTLKIVELKRWQDAAIHALKKSGSAAAPFHTEYVGEEEQTRILAGLAQAKSIPAIKAVFDKPQLVAPRLAENELQGALADYMSGLETRIHTELKKTLPNQVETRNATA